MKMVLVTSQCPKDKTATSQSKSVISPLIKITGGLIKNDIELIVQFALAPHGNH